MVVGMDSFGIGCLLFFFFPFHYRFMDSVWGNKEFYWFFFIFYYIFFYIYYFIFLLPFPPFSYIFFLDRALGIPTSA